MRLRIRVGEPGVNAAGRAVLVPAPVPLAVDVNAPLGVEVVVVRRDGQDIHLFNPRGAQRLSPQLLRVAWRGQPGECWDGYLELLDNQVATALPYALPPAEGALHPLGPRRLGWTSRPTANTSQGLVLRLQRPLAGLLIVHLRGQQFQLNLGSFRGRAQHFAVGERGVLEVCRLPDLPPPRDLQVTWRDAEATPGLHIYDALVTLADGTSQATAPITVQVDA